MSSRPPPNCPDITKPVIIDGTTQPGYAGIPLIELDGSTAPFGTDGFNVAASNSEFFGMAIYGFSGNGIDVLPLNVNYVTIQGNYIGINSAGTAIFNGTGIVLDDSIGDTVGGANAGQRNVISGNFTYGLDLRGAGATGIVVSGNIIGASLNGSTAIPNGLAGIYIDNATGNLIGGGSSAAGNLISGNNGPGIELTGSTATGNVIVRNLIGTNATVSAAVPNAQAGILVMAGASSNTIGGGAGSNPAGNFIDFNGQQGISITSGAHNAILANSIFANGSLGIDLGGTGIVATNTGAENPASANDGMNSPVLASVSLSGSTLQIIGYVGSAPNETAFAGARVELFGSGVDGQGRFISAP